MYRWGPTRLTTGCCLSSEVYFCPAVWDMRAAFVRDRGLVTQRWEQRVDKGSVININTGISNIVPTKKHKLWKYNKTFKTAACNLIQDCLSDCSRQIKIQECNNPRNNLGNYMFTFLQRAVYCYLVDTLNIKLQQASRFLQHKDRKQVEKQSVIVLIIQTIFNMFAMCFP